MTIKSDGKVGINVEDPFADLEVEGKVGISNTTNGGELQFQYTKILVALSTTTPSTPQNLVGYALVMKPTHKQVSTGWQQKTLGLQRLVGQMS